ncbi:MAG: hypothetical protein FJZ47_15285 [Candidatus Tectomicrobia bacterium]|uniref:Nucleoside phosphorylase domain-containing protein n=1 Tax=Tectimicrobiota bacterium TaxID=2528274 RepID=A0A938B4X4_UNCTE|nr:hypothetical protein [Candidatus Tectomicrobia bacterium]
MPGYMAVVTACAQEAALVYRLLQSRQPRPSPAGLVWQGQLHQQEVVVIQGGMGPAHASQALHWLSQQYPLQGVLSVGFAGALHADLKAGDALLVTHLLPAQTATADTAARGLWPDARLAHIAAMAVAQAAVVSHSGTLVHTPTVVTQASSKQALGQRSGALAVDMESYSIGTIAVQQAIPFAILRTVFDTSNEDFLMPMGQCTTANGCLQSWRLLACLLAQPSLLLALPHWWWASRCAGQHLQRWLRHFFLLLQQGA